MHSSCTKTVSNQSGFCRGLSTHSPVSSRANVKRVWNGHRKTDWLVRKPFNIRSTVMPWCRAECLQGSPDLSKAEMPVKGDLWDVFLRCRDMSSQLLSFKMYRHVKSKSASLCFFLFVLYGLGYLDVLTARRFQLSSLMFIVHLLSQHFLFNFFPGSPSMKGASPKSRPRWIIRTANAFPHGASQENLEKCIPASSLQFYLFRGCSWIESPAYTSKSMTVFLKRISEIQWKSITIWWTIQEQKWQVTSISAFVNKGQRRRGTQTNFFQNFQNWLIGKLKKISHRDGQRQFCC